MAIWNIKETYKKERRNVWSSISAGLGMWSAGRDSGGNNLQSLEYTNLATTGNATAFGDCTITGSFKYTTSNNIRGLRGGGFNPGNTNIIDYVHWASAGNASDFGDLSSSREGGNTGAATNTRGFFSAGSGFIDTIEFITFASTGNPIDWGDLTQSRAGGASSNSPTRALYGGGATPEMVTTIDYFSVVSAGDATDFGDLTQTRGEISTAGNSTRAIWAGGRESASPGAQSNIIDYVTIASVGNASDFGDLTAVRRYPGGTSNQQRGVFGGGDTPSSTDVMDYIAIAATSDAADFGDLVVARYYVVGSSSYHGGLEADKTQRPSVNYMPGSGRVLFGGGYTPGNPYMSTIEIVNALTLGNTSDFGELSVGRRGAGGTGSSTRGLFFAGNTPTYSDVIDSIELASTGNAADFGNLSRATGRGAALSSTTRGIFGGGLTGPSPYTRENEIEYVTIASAGNITDFGDLTVARSTFASGSSAVRGVFGGGYAPGYSDVIDYVTIASAGDAADFGDLSAATGTNTGAASSTRALSAGGYSPGVTDVIDYITIASTGDASDFGDLLAVTRGITGGSIGALTRAIFGGGYATPNETIQNVIQYVTIASTGDAADFGDLSGVRGFAGCTSDSHGGLQG